MSEKLLVYERPKKNQYIDKFFCWIEQGDNEKIEQYLKIHAENVKQKLYAQNNWNPYIYGNKVAFQLLKQYQFPIEHTSNYSLVHAACFGNELETLQFLVDELKEPVNPQSQVASELTPLRFVSKVKFKKIQEFLIKRGGYYVDDDYCNNLQKKIVKIDETCDTATAKADPIKSDVKYYTLNMKDPQEVQAHYILKINNELDPQIKSDDLRKLFNSFRFRDFLFFQHLAKNNAEKQNENTNLSKLYKILNNANFKATIQKYI